MTKKPTLSELLHQWERDGASPEELCRDCPELLDELQRNISQRAAHDLASSSTVHPETPPTKPKAPNTLAPNTATPGTEVFRSGGESQDPPAKLSQNPTVSHIFREEAGEGNETAQIFIDRYRLDEKVGRGGFGEVWKAFDPQLNRVVAVKVPRLDRSHSRSQIDGFLAEARKAASLRHEHIVRVYDVQPHAGSCIIISEFIEGKNLGIAMRDSGWSICEKVKIVADVAAALHFAHQRGVIHRDVKPGNILMSEEGKPCLTDFGLAVTEEDQLNEPPGICGTPKYMSPEQARGESHRADPRTDIYSLGVALYEMLTNRPPYKAKTAEEYIEQIIHKEPWPLRSLDASIPHELERICLKCLAKSVGDRYTTAGDLADELRRWLRESADTSEIRPIASEPSRLARRPTWMWLGGAAVVLIVAFVATWAIWQDRPEGLDNRNKRLPNSKDGVQPPNGKELPKLPDSLAWISKLNVTPKELIWPGYKAEGKKPYSDKENGALVIAGSQLQLVQLGEIRSGEDCTISVDIYQPKWSGSAGIFLGYHIVEKPPGRKRAAFQHLELVRTLDDHKNSVLQLHRRQVFAQPGNGSFMGGPIRYEKLVLPSSGKATRLTIRIVRNKLQAATWGSQRLKRLTTPEANQLFKQKNYIGAWGVFGRLGTTFFSNAQQTAHDMEKKNG